MDLCPINTFCFDKNTFLLVVIAGIVLITHYIGRIDNKLIDMEKNIEYSELKMKNKLNKYATRLDKPLIDSRKTSLFNDRIDNPLAAPERSYSTRRVPINIATQGEPTGFQQVGILIQQDGTGNNQTKLPLYGEQIYPRSREWRYYVGSDNYQSVKLGLSYQGRDSMDRHGIQELYDGSIVDVQGYDSKFVVSMYKLDTPKYLPHII